jgi:hypothetical protein
MQLNDRTRLRNDASCALRGCRAARVMGGAGGLGRRTQSRCRARKPTAAAISDGGADEGLAIRVSYGSSSCACGKQVSMSSPLDLKRGNIHRARVFAPWNPPSPPVRVPRDPARDKPLFAATARAGFSSAKQPACPARQGERTLFDGFAAIPWNLRVYAGVTLRATQLVREDSE